LTDPAVRAAGGIVVREGDAGQEVAIVHRPRYDDWSLPKGKLQAGEGWEEGALREVEEETGLRCSLEREVASSRYEDARGRDKLVRYWLMRESGGEFEPNDEVDEIRWLAPEQAMAKLSYDRDREVLRSAL
jgi:8-oxo-dGTP diphosphatase